MGAVATSAARLAKLRRNWALVAGVAEVLKRGPSSLLIAVVVASIALVAARVAVVAARVAVVAVVAALGGKSVEAGTRQAAVKMKAS